MNTILSTRSKIREFVKDYYSKYKIVPSIRKIEKKFRIKFRTYYPNGVEELYNECGFDFTPQENKRKAIKDGIKTNLLGGDKKNGRKRIVEYLKEEVRVGRKVTKAKLEKHFHISLKTYFPGGMRELYREAGIEIPLRLRDKTKLREEIIDYVRLEAKNGHYPTYDELNEKFRTNLNRIFTNMREVYSLANVPYIREKNPFIKLEKERKLTKICIKLFLKLGYDIDAVSILSSKKGPDIILRDKKGNLIPVEIKAYHKYGKVGERISLYSPYFGDEVSQLRNYIKKLKAPFGFLVTSTNRSSIKKKPKNMQIIFAKDLEKMLKEHGLRKELKELEWVNETHLSISKEKTIKKMRNEILFYVKREIKKGRYVSKHEIEKTFQINLQTYFKSIREVYKSLGINPYLLSHFRMGGNVEKNVMREMILDYFKSEVKKDHYPTYKEIQNKFKCLPKSFFPGGIREIFKLAGLTYKRKFASKTPEEKEEIRKAIIEFVKESSKNGIKPTWRQIKDKFRINIKAYFRNGIAEIYKLANVDLGSRKGLRKCRLTTSNMS